MARENVLVYILHLTGVLFKCPLRLSAHRSLFEVDLTMEPKEAHRVHAETRHRRSMQDLEAMALSVHLRIEYVLRL